MLIDSFSNRLKTALEYNNMKQIELSQKTNIDKSLISNYLKGKYEAKQNNVFIMAKVLDVSEAWLMGYDVPMFRQESIQNGKIPKADMDFFKNYMNLEESYKKILRDTLNVFINNKGGKNG